VQQLEVEELPGQLAVLEQPVLVGEPVRQLVLALLLVLAQE